MSGEKDLETHQWGEPSIDRVRSIRLDGVNILLVDDSFDNQRLFHRILTAAGAHVDLADNGEVAVAVQGDAMNSPRPYDVVIMDIRMPVLDGYEATRRIRAQGYRAPIIALTAHANPDEEDRCRLAGCSHFYLKPIDRLSLLTAVQKALGPAAPN
jgi:CheY-like chemotaxis protein